MMKFLLKCGNEVNASPVGLLCLEPLASERLVTVHVVVD